MRDPYQSNYGIIIVLFIVMLASCGVTLGYDMVGWLFKTYGG